jgi:hypothetical protein
MHFLSNEKAIPSTIIEMEFLYRNLCHEFIHEGNHFVTETILHLIYTLYNVKRDTENQIQY